MKSYFWYKYRKIRTRKNFVFGYFSCSVVFSVVYQFLPLHSSLSARFTMKAFLQYWSYIAVMFDVDTLHVCFFSAVVNSIVFLEISSSLLVMVRQIQICVVLCNLVAAARVHMLYFLCFNFVHTLYYTIS